MHVILLNGPGGAVFAAWRPVSGRSACPGQGCPRARSGCAGGQVVLAGVGEGAEGLFITFCDSACSWVTRTGPPLCPRAASWTAPASPETLETGPGSGAGEAVPLPDRSWS